MTWQNPRVWVGLATIALPVVIHLLGQDRARRLPFPTLRFFGASRPLPTRRTRVHDIVLLAVRIGIFTAAVAALAQPFFFTARRQAGADNALVRAIIVDTSASMQRASTGGEPAATAARRIAQQLADSAQSRSIIVTALPAAVIAGATAWLGQQAGRADLAIVSDFQEGTLSNRDLAKVPAAVGVHLVRIPVTQQAGPLTTTSRQGNGDVIAEITTAATGTSVTWRAADRATGSSSSNLLMIGAPDDASAIAAVSEAARTIAVRLPLDTSRAIAIEFPRAADRTALLGGSTAVHSAWMADALLQVHRDPLLTGSAAGATVPGTARYDSTLVIARTASGRPAVIGGEATVQGRDRLVLFPLDAAGSLTSAALIGAATRALSVAPPVDELDPAFISDSALSAWQRPPGATGRATRGDESDGRWLWVLVLVLLVVETFLRRTPQGPAATAVAADARV
jgi:hypothetical protein